MENLIPLLFYAQQEFNKDYVCSKGTEEAFELSCDIAEKLISEFENNDKLKDLYYKLDEAKSAYTVKVEDDAYRFGFRSGFKMATELGLINI